MTRRKHGTSPTRAAAIFAAALAAAAFAGPAPAQDGIRTEQVRFPAGTSGTTVRGTITGRDAVAYQVGAEAGQTMTVRLEASNLATYFNVYAPGSGPGDEALAIGGQTGPMMPDLNRFEATLPLSGTYTISVYMMRSAARRGERSDYTLEISITGATGEIVQGDFADGLAGGPDFFEVRTARGGMLNLRSAPSTAASVVTRLASGTTVRNLGCRMAEGRRWCRVATPADPGVEGWAAGDFLVEGSGVSAQQPSSSAPADTGAAIPGTAEQACLAAVSRETSNADVTLLGSEPSQAGTLVRVGVGPDRAAWQCIAYPDGTTGGIMFLSEDAMVPGTDFHASGQTECYATSGAGAQTCRYGVTRAGNGNGSVTVTLPAGQTRVITYQNGQPIDFDRSEADGDISFEAWRQDNGYMVFIGDQGVFLPDAAIWGG
jgi:hypothetical protein